MGRSLSIALGVAKRSLVKSLKHPIPALPPILIPLFMFAAFAGALSAIAKTKNFDYYDYTAFEFGFVIFLAAMLSGGFSAFEIISDYGAGLGNRMMLAAPRRMAILAGYVLFSLVRFLVTLAIIWGVALAAGLNVKGGALDVAGFIGLALLLNLATNLYASGIALRLQSGAGGGLITVAIFVVLFLSPVFVPRSQLSGWVKTAADYNPLTPVVEAGRGFLAGDPTRVAVAFAVAGGLVVAFALFALRGMVKAARGPKGGRRRRRPGAGPGAEEPA
jgi:ABC-2 type transport system permease protein